MALTIPGWLDALLVRALKAYLPPSAVADMLVEVKAKIVAEAKALAASTEASWDDAIVAELETVLNGCNPDLQFICDLIEKGEVAVIDFLRTAASGTPSKLDDHAVEVLAAALAA